VAKLFFAEIYDLSRQAGWTSHDHFTADGTLIESWASLKSFVRKDGAEAKKVQSAKDDDPGNPTINFRGEKRSNDTHESKTDPDAQLLIAVLLTNGGDLPEAEKVCRHVLNLDELNAGAHYLIALCREHVGDQVGAVQHDQTAAYLDSAFAMPHLHLGLVAKRSADVETARRELGRALPLLDREDASRILLFGGGFTREALVEFCRAELRACGGAS